VADITFIVVVSNVLWYSKRQNTVENSSFGLEMLAQKQAVDMIEGLTYKLRIMGIPIDGVTNIFL